MNPCIYQIVQTYQEFVRNNKHKLNFVLLFSFLLSDPTLAQWSTDTNVNNPICTAQQNQIYHQTVSDGSGGAIITWEDQRNGNSDIYAQRIDANGVIQWNINGVVICNASDYQRYPMIASDGSGGAIITWRDNRSGYNYDIYAQRVNNNGTVQWIPNGTAICAESHDQNSPTIVEDGSGGVIITWDDDRSFFHDIYAQRISANGNVQWATNGVTICAASGFQRNPTIVSDASGGAIIAWQDHRNASNDDIYIQRINASGITQWTTNGVAVCTATGDQLYLNIVHDGSGGAIVVWQDQRSSTNYDIYCQRVNSNGVIQWATNGVTICTGSGPGTSWSPTPKICSDGTGGAIVAWDDSRSSVFNWDLYVQRINASGVVQWATNGVTISTASNDQNSPAIIVDGAGGAIISWRDYRSLNWDIYAQRVNASGVVQWGTNGRAISTAASNINASFYPTIVNGGSDGAIITFEDVRSSTSEDIYAQRINLNGNLGPKFFTVTATAGSNGNISPSGTMIVSNGGSQSFIITPNTGYYVFDVQVDGISVGAITSYSFTNVNANHSIHVTFAINKFVISAYSGPNGSIYPGGPVSVNYGDSKSFVISANTGYHILNVLVDASTVGAITNYDFTNVTTNHTISATFEMDCSQSQTVNLAYSVPNGVLCFSSVQANGLTLQAFNGSLGYSSLRKIFGDGVMVVLPCECKTVLLKLAKVNFTGDYNPTFDLSDPNISYGYRYLRAAGSQPANPSFAPFILNASGGYAYQEFSQNVPLSAWDVSNSLSPQRLALGFLENNVANGLVDGKYWPGSDALFDNVATSGPREWLFIFDEPYSAIPNSTYTSNILDVVASHRVMYLATWNRIDQSAFSPANSGDDQFLISTTITNVATEDNLPEKFSLSQNFPNPFNPTTTISYHVPVAVYVTLKVYDMLGREVTTLVSEAKAPGRYEVKFHGTELSSGIYFYRLQAGIYGETRKLLLLK